MLADKTADGFAMDDVQLYGLIAESPDPAQFKVVGKFLTIEPLAIMLSKDDAAFKKVVDDEMRHLIRSGEAEKIYDRWFMAPIPPKNVVDEPAHELPAAATRGNIRRTPSPTEHQNGVARYVLSRTVRRAT